MNEFDWLLVRKAAIQWAEQVNHGQPGPEPLMSVVNDLITRKVNEEKGRRYDEREV